MGMSLAKSKCWPDCGLPTSNKKMYVSWLTKGGAKEVRISVFGTNEQAEQTVYLVRAA